MKDSNGYDVWPDVRRIMAAKGAPAANTLDRPWVAQLGEKEGLVVLAVNGTAEVHQVVPYDGAEERLASTVPPYHAAIWLGGYMAAVAEPGHLYVAGYVYPPGVVAEVLKGHADALENAQKEKEKVHESL